MAAPLLLAGAAAISAFGPPQREELASLEHGRPVEILAAVGCWRIVGWAGPTRRWLPDSATLYLDSTPTERMDSTVAPTILRVDRLRVDSAVQERAPLKLSGWGVESGSKRLVVWLGDGFTGVRMRLRQHGDMLHGTARSFSDSWPDVGLPEPVRAARVSCPAEASQQAATAPLAR